ncbi:rRNA (guanine-N2)-methyltransferase [Lewinellaceae bacterium SD302]|nr:rRNA (guanine-N2)-methyltransferase [Lewinellaceae bacterium SD302]
MELPEFKLMRIDHAGRTYRFKRYPETNNHSLQPISAADELLLSGYQSSKVDKKGTALFHDRFGVLACLLHDDKPQFVSTFMSQQRALGNNLAENKLGPLPGEELGILSKLKASQIGLLRVPKSLELFELYLSQFARMAATADPDKPPVLLAGFMTRHFTPALLKIAERYANSVEQGRAVKKARVLTIGEFKKNTPSPDELIHSITYGERTYQQYYGVFSANHIDYATQFLLEYAEKNDWFGLSASEDTRVVDIACGNGVIGAELMAGRPKARLISFDDLSLATLSANKNLPSKRSRIIWDDGLSQIADDSTDLAITNPPFHFGHETNIEVSLSLFKQAKRVLKPNGQLIIVSNRHLNYTSHLRQLFGSVETLMDNPKFEILRARP